MKDSKEKEHRISNLKNMINNVAEEEEPQPYDDDVEEDNELINYLNEDSVDFDKLEIDDEFIYHPGDEDNPAINLEENNINEDYIIKAPKTEDNDETTEIHEVDDLNDDIVGDISENFDNVINAKIGGKPILAIASAVIGIILLIISSFIFSSRSDRIIDNVVAGETSFAVIIFIILGLLLLGYGVYRLFNIDNPFSKMTGSIDAIDTVKDNENKTNEPPKEKPSPKVIPKSKIPLDKESFKIGEFKKDDLKTTLKKPANSKKNKPSVQEDLEDIPPAKEKSSEKKGLTDEEIEEMEYEQVKLDTESIDDIFSEVEEIDDLPIISIDSKEENK